MIIVLLNTNNDNIFSEKSGESSFSLPLCIKVWGSYQLCLISRRSSFFGVII